MNKLLSVVIPCYNEENNVEDVFNAVIKQSDSFGKLDVDFELIFVDDGSKDGTVEKVNEIKAKYYSRVKLVRLSRNFGKEAAMYAGLLEAKGDYVSIMDADLQDPPELLPEMLRRVSSGECDCVVARRVSRKGEPPIRSFFANRFYRIMAKLSDVNLVDGERDFRVMTREVTDAILEISEKNRFSKGIFAWVGFNTQWIEYENVERGKGASKWSFFSLLLYAIDGIIAFSNKPLAITSIIGLVFFVIAIILILVTIVRTLVFGDPVSGWPSMACIIFFVSGIQLFCSGILGMYVSKIYTETKNRPVFIVRKDDEDNKTDINLK